MVVTQVCHALRHTHRDHSTFGVYYTSKPIGVTYNMSERSGATREVAGQSSRNRQGVPEAIARGLVS